MTAYPTASLTADVVLFNVKNEKLYVLLVERGGEPYKGMWALPGGFVNASNDPTIGEEPIDAAVRELREETGIELHVNQLDLVGVYATPGRDPRGRVVTFAYWAIGYGLKDPVAADDAIEARWIWVSAVMEQTLAFDHNVIAGRAYTLMLRSLRSQGQ